MTRVLQGTAHVQGAFLVFPATGGTRWTALASRPQGLSSDMQSKVRPPVIHEANMAERRCNGR